MNATDFGLLALAGPDAISLEQSDKLRLAVDAAAGAGLPLFIPAGDYAAGGIDLPSGLSVFGVRGLTVLRAPGDGPIFTAAGSSRLSLSDLVLIGGAAGADTRGLLHFTECSDVRLDRLTLHDGGANLVHFEGTSGRIEDCDLDGCADTGIFAVDSTPLAITGNRIGDCGNGGVRVWASEPRSIRATVTGNVISEIRFDGGGNGQNGNGINVFKAGDVRVQGNHISGCAFSAIRLNATTDTIVSGNTCLDSGEVAIFSEFAFSGSVISDNIVDRAAQGISITNFDQGGRLGSCTGNIVRNIAPRSLVNPDTTPAGIFAEADAVIAGNVVENVPGVGIGAGWGPYLRDVAITGNLVRDADIGIGVSVAEGAGEAVVTGNRVSGARRAGIAGLAWTEMVSDDLPRDSAGFPHVTLTGNSVG